MYIYGFIFLFFFSCTLILNFYPLLFIIVVCDPLVQTFCIEKYSYMEVI